MNSSIVHHQNDDIFTSPVFQANRIPAVFTTIFYSLLDNGFPAILLFPSKRISRGTVFSAENPSKNQRNRIASSLETIRFLLLCQCARRYLAP